MSDFKLQRPAAYMELLQRFEEAKKSVSTKVRAPIVIRPPYAFIEHYVKYSDKDVSILYFCYDLLQHNVFIDKRQSHLTSM